MNDRHKNVTFALSEQRLIDLKLEARLNALEEVMIKMGQDIQNFKTQLATKCHEDISISVLHLFHIILPLLGTRLRYIY